MALSLSENVKAEEFVLTIFEGQNVEGQFLGLKKKTIPLEEFAGRQGFDLRVVGDLRMLKKTDLTRFAESLSQHEIAMFAFKRMPDYSQLNHKLKGRGYDDLEFEALLPDLELAIHWYDDCQGQVITRDIDVAMNLVRTAALLSES